MLVPITLVFGAVGFPYFKLKAELSLIQGAKIDTLNEQIEDDDLYQDLEDIFT